MSLEPETHRTIGEHSITEFLALFDGLKPDQMADELFVNRQRTSTRSGILKAEAVQRFACALKEAGIDDFRNLTEERVAAAEAMVRNIPGQGSGISFDYFRMLAGDDTLIKPDRMVQRYIARAIGRTPDTVGPDLTRDILQSATTVLAQRGYDWSPRRLDYAIWTAQRLLA